MPEAERPEPGRLRTQRLPPALQPAAGAHRRQRRAFRPPERSRCTRSCWRAARRQAAAGLSVAGLRVGQEGRDPPGQQRRRLGRRGRSHQLPGRDHDLLTALGRRDARPRRHDVGHRLVAGVADPGQHRLGGSGHRPRHDLGLEGGQVRPRAAAAHHGDDVAVAPASIVTARAMEAGAPGPCTGTLHVRDRNPNPEPVSWPRKSRQPSVPGLATRPDVQRRPRAAAGPRCAAAGPRPRALAAAAARCAAIRPSNAVTSSSARMRLISPLAR